MKTQYFTATSIDGYLADDQHPAEPNQENG